MRIVQEEKMWRSKQDDLNLIEDFNRSLTEFQRLKLSKWEKVDEKVQMSIIPGTPSEDWIIPPDENKTFEILSHDPEYMQLRQSIINHKAEIKKCADFLNFKAHHDYDLLTFTSPLIGNAALEDAIEKNHQLLKKCEESCYFWKNLSSFLSG